MSDDYVVKELKDIYNDNMQWLNFAELKNGALLTLTAVILGLLNDVMGNCNMKYVFLFLGVIIIAICMFSYYPYLNKIIQKRGRLYEIVKKSYKKTGKDALESMNVVFYVSVFLSEKKLYMKAIKKVLGLDKDYLFTHMEENYIDQIIAISNISCIKYYMFKLAIRLFGVMTLLMLVGILIA